MLKRRHFSPERFDYNARKVYGIIISLSIIISLEHNQESPLKIMFFVLGTLFAIALAEVYVKYTAKILKTKKKPVKKEKISLLKEEFSVMFAADIPVFVFFLQIFNVISIGTAFFLAKALSLLSLFLYGYVAGVVLEKSCLTKIILGFSSLGLGFLIILLKLFFQ